MFSFEYYLVTSGCSALCSFEGSEESLSVCLMHTLKVFEGSHHPVETHTASSSSSHFLAIGVLSRGLDSHVSSSLAVTTACSP